MRQRRPGGCLYAVIFIISLVLCALLITVMLSSIKSTDGGNLFTEILKRVGISTENNTQDGQSDRTEPDDSGSISDLPAKDAIIVELTQDKLRELLENALAGSFPLTLDEIIITSDSTLTIKGSAKRDSFIELLDGDDSALGSLERITLQLAPEEITFDAKVGVTFDGEAGVISLDPKKLTVAGLNIPVSLLPPSFIEKINTSLTEFFASYGQTPAGVTLYDGYMRVYFE